MFPITIRNETESDFREVEILTLVAKMFLQYLRD